jgi:hypothetical protein
MPGSWAGGANRTGLCLDALLATEVLAVMTWIREQTGIYGLGFRKSSVTGLILPIAFVVIVGGLGILLTIVL